MLKHGTVYLNHAATGALSTKVVAAVEKYLEERSETEIENYFSFQPVLAGTRELAARLLHTSPDRIAFSDNTSNALNILAAGFEWKQGDRIILNDLEFPANVYPFMNLKRFGIEIDFVKNREGKILAEDIEAAMTARTKLVSTSHVQFLSGYRADIRAIGELCKKHDAMFCVDAIQSAGVVPIDVDQMRIDFLATGGQKWLMAPQGIGFAYVSEEMQDKIKQAYLGWTSIRNSFTDFTRYRLDLDDTAGRYENGTLNYIGIAGLHESLSVLLDIGIESIEEHVLDLGDRLISGLDELGFDVIMEGKRSERSGITSFRVADAQSCYAKLKEAKIEVAVREGMVRVSPHFYNTQEEISALLEKLKG